MKTLASFSFLGFATLAAADIDWVRSQYVVSSRNNPPPGSRDAIKAIISRADSSAKNGPWSVVNTGIMPPSGDKHDFLAWAPYWWPNCQWCPPDDRKKARSNGRARARSLESPFRQHPNNVTVMNAQIAHRLSTLQGDFGQILHVPPVALHTPIPAGFPLPTPSMVPAVQPSPPTLASISPIRGIAPAALTFISVNSLPLESQSGSHEPTPTGVAQAENCTPSPTTSMAPSATWTTCPYVVRDGHTNPDNTMPPNKNQLQQMCQSVFDNSLAFALTGLSKYAQNAAYFLEVFFKDARYRMNPNANYAQLIRGPNPSSSFMGVLDFRSLVQVANAVNILRYTKSPAWDGDKDKAIVFWAKDYIHWLDTNTYARTARTKDNNHVTFFYAQLSALQVLVKDEEGARRSLDAYFNGKFQEQILQNGEQVFEASRARPFHYRCFNLEAMITCAKLADFLGVDYWAKKTKYGAGIQRALDYMMTINPGQDDPTCVFPHITAVAAAYGDPTGKYKRYMQQKQQNGQNWAKETYYFFNQPQAFAMSPAKTEKRAVMEGIEEAPAPVHTDRPAPFRLVDEIELDKSIFLTWDAARPIYEAAAGSLEPEYRSRVD